MIKLITFNIKCGGSGIYSIDHRAPLLKTVLDKYDADIIGFQEATPKWMEYLEKDLGEEYELFNKYRAVFNPESTPIAWRKSRFECLDKGYFWLSDTPDVESGGWDTWGCYRICMWVKLFDKQEGKTMTFFNTHYGFGDENQIKSGKLILDHFKALKVDCGFLTGDLNTTHLRPGHKLLAEHLIDANMATVNDLRHTCHGYNPDRKTGAPIDFCFVTPETVVPLTAKRIDDLVNGEFPSDHYGFYFELELRQPMRIYTQNVDGGTGIRSIMERNNLPLAALQEFTAEGVERIRKYDYMDLVVQEDREEDLTPIVWMKELYEPVEKDVGKKVILAVMKDKKSGKKFCLVNAHLSEDEQEQVDAVKTILEKTAAYKELPTIVTGTLNMRIGSPAYRLLCENFKDLRRSVAPLDYTPTYNGRGEEMAEPCICDYIFTGKIQPLKYELMPSKGRKGYSSDHDGIVGTLILED